MIVPDSLHVGVSLQPEWIRSPCPGEPYTVGECVAIQEKTDAPWTLTFITEVPCWGAYQCSAVNPGKKLVVSDMWLRKLKSIVRRVLFCQFVFRKEVSLPFVISRAENREIILGYPRLGSLLEDTILRKCKPWENFQKGELVALRYTQKNISLATRVLQVLGKKLMVLDPLSEKTRIFSSQRFQKLVLCPHVERISLPDHRCEVGMVESLIRDFSLREYRLCIGSFDGQPQYGYVPTPEQVALDRHRLLHLFSSYFDQECGRCKEKDALEELIVPTNTSLYVQADLHGDLVSLLSLLTWLQCEGYFDEQYRTLSTFHLVFLGDCLDRGVNDIETLSLLVALRLMNPNTVHLIRGNHEDDDVFGRAPSFDAFCKEHGVLFMSFFRSLPLALLVSCQEGVRKKNGDIQHQYVHMSHGLFSLCANPALYLRGENSVIVLNQDMFSPEGNERQSEKGRRASLELVRRFRDLNEAWELSSYLWSDIDETSGLSLRGEGCRMCPEDISLYRTSLVSRASKVCAFVRGHQHIFKEHVYENKVIATTLPGSLATGCWGLSTTGVQGVVLTVQPKVREWKKSSLLFTVDSNTYMPSFEYGDVEKGMYDPIVESDPSNTI